jgi:hypothetical protein
MSETLNRPSSWVAELSYDEENEILSAVTKKGEQMHWAVPPDVWEQIKATPSVGSALSNLVMGVFPRV